MLTSLSVKDLVQAIKKSVDQNFSAVKVSGELTNVSKSISGHFYFSLSDDEAMISCVIFKNAAMRIPHLATLKDGENVEISGQVSVYAKRGNLQIIVSDLTLLNKDGLLKKKFEEVKKKLALEGLFDIEKKKKIPLMAKKIAVVAAPRSAALQDFLTVLGRRAFFYDVLIIPALVQGEGAAVSLRKAIKLADSKEDIDVIVVTRGGGSLEDLWCFNDEELARTIFQCSKPVISAVGHDVDYTIIDYVSDQRCETPTAAAELISAYQLKVRDQMENYFQRILRVMEQKVTRVKVVLERLSPHFILARMNNRLRSLKNRLEIFDFFKLLNRRFNLMDKRIRLDEAMVQMKDICQNRTNELNQRLEKLNAKLEALSPMKVLERGYVIVKESDKVFSSKVEILKAKPSSLSLQFFDGAVELKKVEIQANDD